VVSVPVDVLLRVAAGEHLPVRPLERSPQTSAVVGSTEDQYPSRSQHPDLLRQADLITRNMLDHFGAHHRIEDLVPERQAIHIGLKEHSPRTSEPAELPDGQVHADAPREVLHDPAGSAANIKDAPAAGDEILDDLESPPLPVAL
jgi:hypothetical protein